MDGSGSSDEQFSLGLQNTPLTSHRISLSFNPNLAYPYRVIGPEMSSDAGGEGGRYNAEDVVNDELNMNRSGEPLNRKRGRPRKKDTDASMALGMPNSSAVIHSSGVGVKLSSGESSMPTSQKRRRGRPPGSKSKPKTQAIAGAAGSELTTYVLLNVEAGKDVYNAISSFVANSQRSFCFLTASGEVSKVTLRQAGSTTPSVFQAKFKITSLSGTSLLAEHDGLQRRKESLNLTLCDINGKTLSGEVAGHIEATTPVQVMMCSFLSYTSNASTMNSTSPSPLLPLLTSERQREPAVLLPGNSLHGQHRGGPEMR